MLYRLRVISEELITENRMENFVRGLGGYWPEILVKVALALSITGFVIMLYRIFSR